MISHQIQMSCFLRFLWAVTDFHTWLVSDDLESFKKHWSGILQDVPLLEICLMSFLMIRLKLWVTGKKTTKVPFSCPEIMDTYYQHDLILLIWALISWLRSCFISLRYCKSTLLLPPLPYCTLWKEITLLLLKIKYLIKGRFELQSY